MNKSDVLRKALWLTTFFNFGGALLFLFPSSLGQVAGLPTPVSPLYSWFITYIIVLFGLTYGWLARQAQPNRPIVFLAALGKSGFFVIVLACWLMSEVPSRCVLIASGDLAFALVFFWWLAGEPELASAAQQGVPADRPRAARSAGG